MNTKNRITVGEFNIPSNHANFTINLADVIEKLKPIIAAAPDNVKPSIEITFTGQVVNSGYIQTGRYSELYGSYQAVITREMTLEEYAKASDAPSKASKITVIKNCFDSKGWTGRH